MSLTKTEIENAANLLCSAHDTQQQLSQAELAACTPETIDDAYSIQDAVAQKRWLAKGQRTHAWKIGALSSDVPAYAAPIPPQVVHSSPAQLPAQDFCLIGIEAELAYRFAKDLPPQDGAYTKDQVFAAIDGVYAAIEVVDTRLGEWREAGDWWRLADNQINGALVLGSGRENWQELDPQQQGVELLFDGKVQVSSKGTHPMGDPCALLSWIGNHCAGRCGGLKAGDVIITGTWTGLLFVEPGTEVTARFAGVGEAVVTFPK